MTDEVPARRALLHAALGFTAAAALPARASARALGRIDATLSASAPRVGGVRAFPTLAAALAAAPPGGTRYRVRIPAGTWREHVRISRPNVELVGDSRASSVLVFDDRANAPRAADVPGSTLEVCASGFRAAHLTLANDWDYPHNLPAEVAWDRTGASGAQARAVHLAEGADRSQFEDCAITGWQDTLFTDCGRAWFRGCLVSGCVDFIYGAGVVLFERCEIRARTRPGKEFHGFIVAPDTDVGQAVGIVFDDCRLTKEADMPAHSMALGRPWRRTGTFADGRYGNPRAVPHAAYLRCWMDDHIVPEGWYPMHYNDRAGQRVMLQPEEARLFEYRSRGPGAGVPSARRRQLDAAAAAQLTRRKIFGDWRPDCC